MNHYYLNTGGVPPWLPILGILIPIVVLWSLFWKGLALWHSGRRGQYWWFIILLIVNSLGILEIIYLFGIAKLHFDQLFTINSGSTPVPPAPPIA